MQETCFFHLIVNQSINEALLDIADRTSLTGRMTSPHLNTRVQALTPDFYGSDDFSSDREAGYLLSQTYTSPNIVIPLNCFQLPEQLEVPIPEPEV